MVEWPSDLSFRLITLSRLAVEEERTSTTEVWRSVVSAPLGNRVRATFAGVTRLIGGVEVADSCPRHPSGHLALERRRQTLKEIIEAQNLFPRDANDLVNGGSTSPTRAPEP